MTVLNFRTEERYKIENTVLVGLMPGPAEPKRICPFLDRLIDEFLDLGDGLSIDSGVLSSYTLHAALLCFISDITATRKMFGFPGFKVGLGYSKCFKEFSCDGFGKRMDYSRYDHNNWTFSSIEHHKQSPETIKKASTPTERQELQRQNEVSVSILCKLPYFNGVRCHLIDAMHNFYLGTA